MDESDYSYELVVGRRRFHRWFGPATEGDRGNRLLRFGTNRGSGSARKYGTQASEGSIIVWTDVDMTYPNDTIPDLLDQLDGYDQVVGARTSEEGTVKPAPRAGKWLIRKLASYLTGVRIPDLNSGFRAFRREVACSSSTCSPRVLMRDHHHDGLPLQWLLGAIRPDRLRASRRRIEVPLVEGHEALPPPGAASHLDVGANADLRPSLRSPRHHRRRQVGLRPHRQGLQGRHQHNRDPRFAFALALIGMVADMLVQLNKRPHDVMPATIE